MATANAEDDSFDDEEEDYEEEHAYLSGTVTERQGSRVTVSEPGE
jgi:hypothetical protein